MKKLIIALSLLACFNVLAQDVPTEASWKAKLRGIITQVAGESWSTKLLGPAPVAVDEGLKLPEIPKDVKKSTDVTSYTKLKKDPTEFDKLPAERKRQFNYNYLEELFQATRKTEPKDEDLATWLNALEQGGSREGIYQGLVLDEVYNNLESIGEKPTKKLLDYLLKYSQTFHKQTFKPESLDQLNLYSLKRIFTEKGLDLMAYYESRDLESLYRWYALYSAFVAKEYEPMLKTPLRKNQDPESHYLWAKSMPNEHIKSEYIIKMHTVMNQLQLLTQE